MPEGNKTREPHRYGMSSWTDLFSPRQQLAHGYCVQAFRELVDEDRTAGVLDDTRQGRLVLRGTGIGQVDQYGIQLTMTRWHGQEGTS